MEMMPEIKLQWVLGTLAVLAMLALLLRLGPWRGHRRLNALRENVEVAFWVIAIVFLFVRPFLFQPFFIPSASMEPTLMGPPPGSAATAGDRLIANVLIYRVADPARGDIAVFHAPKEAQEGPDDVKKDFVKRVVGLPGETVEVRGPRVLLDGKVALKLGDNAAIGTLVRVDEQGPGAMRIVSRERAVDVLAVPELDVRVAGRELLVGGRPVLTSRGEQLRLTPLPAMFGADALVEGTFVREGATPRLVVLRGGQLNLAPGQVIIDGRPLVEPYVKADPHYDMAPLKLEARQYFMLGDNRNESADSHVWGPLRRELFLGRAEIIFWPLHRVRILHWWLLIALALIVAAYRLLARLWDLARAARRKPAAPAEPLAQPTAE
jgi:signal peptidase I